MKERHSEQMLSYMFLAFALLIEGGTSLGIQQPQQHSSFCRAYSASLASFLPRAQPHATRTRCLAASTFSKSDLESTFYSFDADSSGEIDLAELKKALANLGLVASEGDVRTLFRKYDADGGGTIDFEEFQTLIADEVFANAVPQRQISYAMDLFRKFDKDNSGSIDKNEFLGIARKMKAESTRRELISVAAAAYGAFLVSESSFEFQFAQKKLRSKYVDPPAEVSQNLYFSQPPCSRVISTRQSHAH